MLYVFWFAWARREKTSPSQIRCFKADREPLGFLKVVIYVLSLPVGLGKI